MASTFTVETEFEVMAQRVIDAIMTGQLFHVGCEGCGTDKNLALWWTGNAVEQLAALLRDEYEQRGEET